ncbi:MAG: ankyrin repeat domain-containing protein, partial [Legionella longbeachae]|nr:ankyrin repeat domain-containing protein [Legionella longbeachae]
MMKSKLTYRDLPNLVEKNDLKTIEEIIKSQRVLNEHFPYFCNEALAKAIEINNLDIAAYLLKNGSKVSDQFVFKCNNIFFYMPFIAFAVAYGNPKMINLLLDHGGLDLIRQALSNNIEIGKKYISKSVMAYLNSSSSKKQIKSIQSEYHHIIQCLLNNAQSIELSDFMRPFDAFKFLNGLDNLTGLSFIGISYCGKPLTPEYLKKILIESKMHRLCDTISSAIFTLNDVNDPSQKSLLQVFINSYGKVIDDQGIINLVPLWAAVKYQQIDTVRTRLTFGSDPNEISAEARHTSSSPIHFAAKNGDLEIAILLLNHHKFDLKTLPKAIKIAKENKHEQLVELFLFHLSQNINFLDKKGRSLLHFAIKDGDSHRVEQLITQGANVNTKYKDMSPLSLAIWTGLKYKSFPEFTTSFVKIIKLLLKHKADPNLSDENNNDLIRRIAEFGSAELIESLLPLI